MKIRIFMATAFAVILVFSNVQADSLFDRAGQEYWYKWYGPDGKPNGYSFEKYELTTNNGLKALKTTSNLYHKSKGAVNTFSIHLLSTELEPMVKYVLSAKEEKGGTMFSISVKGKPSGENYKFEINRNGEIKQIKTPRKAFEYFDFEDHFLYGRMVPGKDRKFKVLNSFSLGVEEKSYKYEGDETIKVGKKKYECKKFITKSTTTTSTVYRDAATGAIVKQTFDNGSYIEISTKEKAEKVKK